MVEAEAAEVEPVECVTEGFSQLCFFPGEFARRAE